MELHSFQDVEVVKNFFTQRVSAGVATVMLILPEEMSMGLSFFQESNSSQF